jgi:hypothetical protein
LPGKKALVKSDTVIEVTLIDASESPVERPKKRQRPYYSGKKKRHTAKSQVVVNKRTKKIMATAFAKGKTHYFKLYKNSKVHFKQSTNAITDSGYQGIASIHTNSTVPIKRQKKEKGKSRILLTKAQRQHNHQLASDRILNEHVIGALKRFRIIAERYRNRRKRFGLRFKLIAGIYNLQVGF